MPNFVNWFKVVQFHPRDLNKYKMKSCKECNDEITSKHGKLFCSSKCSASFNNKLRKTKCSNCLYCNISLKGSNKNKKYCSRYCCDTHFKLLQFEKVEAGIQLSSISMKKYLIYKHGNECMECGWNKINKVTGNVPIELEHIDGNSENNNLDNLKLLCPNCHSLTPTYKALNIGNGRYKRMVRYKNKKSY